MYLEKTSLYPDTTSGDSQPESDKENRQSYIQNLVDTDKPVLETFATVQQLLQQADLISARKPAVIYIGMNGSAGIRESADSGSLMTGRGVQSSNSEHHLPDANSRQVNIISKMGDNPFLFKDTHFF